MRLIRPALFALALAASAPAWGQTPPPSLVRAGVTEKVSAHVWAIPDGSARQVPNVGIVVGSKAVLVVDTGMGARNAKTVLDEVAKVGADKPIYLVTTHVHPEHDLGAHAFPASSKLIRSKDQEADIAVTGLTLANTFSRMSPLNAELLAGVSHRKADITFEKDYTLDLGGVTARIVAVGPNHTLGDTIVFVEGDRVLFSGDVAMRPQPSFAYPQAKISHWLASLKELEALTPVIVIPSHGPFGDVSIMAGYTAYLTDILNNTARLKAEGRSEDEAVKIIGGQMKSQPDAGRLAGAVRAAYREAP
jgi:glyoxylase-like metal-dependent hydrolase (beta-lactamase superfamily II)